MQFWALLAWCARLHTSIRLADVVGVWHLQIGEHNEGKKRALRAFESGRCRVGVAMGLA